MGETGGQSKSSDIDFYDTVVVLPAVCENQSIGGSGKFAREPTKGDIGVVLEIFGGGDKVYMVECVNEDGFTLWICDFLKHEIALHEKWKGSSRSRMANILSGEVG